MITLRCTRKLLDRLGVPADAQSDAAPDAALGDWYANLLRFGRDQFIIVVNERTALSVLLPAKDARQSLLPELLRALRWLLAELAVPEEVIARELAAMQPVAYSRTASRSVVATMNERARLAQHVWYGGSSPTEVMTFLARTPRSSGPHADAFPAPAARRLLGLDPLPPPPATVVRLRVSLVDLLPAVWRRILVLEDIELPALHRALQIAMGWKDCHLHEFSFGDVRYGTPDDEFPGKGLRDERGVRLGDALRATGADRITYRYDFGDDWLHELTVEAVEPNIEGVRSVVCLAGANCCPPEDVGGTPGYLEFLQALRDPTHQEHADMVRWVGRPFDPAAFDLALVNALLRAQLGSRAP